MSTTRLLALASLARTVLSANRPSLQYDPFTTKDCIEWDDIFDNSTQTWEQTLRYWGLNPELFHAWNPSVGLNGQPWLNETSYCIVTKERTDNDVIYTTLTTSDAGRVYNMPKASMTVDKDGWTIAVTKSDRVTATSTGYTPGPSPTQWSDLGCYPDNKDHTVFDMRFGPDEALTVPKCWDKCYRLEYEYAGVQNGDVCWCAHKVNGTAGEHRLYCNSLCTGDKNTRCGGENEIGAFKALENKDGASGVATTASETFVGSAVGTGVMQATATASSGARRNVAFLSWTWLSVYV